jgi:hypothetical protein
VELTPTSAPLDSAAPVNDELEVLKLVAERLDTGRIEYMITGSMALSTYAQPRMTRDIDVVIALEPADAERLCALFGDAFECDIDGVRTAISRQGLFNLIHIARIVKVDFIVRKGTPYRLEEFSRRRRLELAGHAMWVASPEDLLLSKLLWAKDSRSPTQLADAASLIESAVLDWHYIEKWASELGVSGLLREVRP